MSSLYTVISNGVFRSGLIGRFYILDLLFFSKKRHVFADITLLTALHRAIGFVSRGKAVSLMFAYLPVFIIQGFITYE